jgi:hypothetical protein
MIRAADFVFSLILFVGCTPKDADTSKPKGDEGTQAPTTTLDTFEDRGGACISGVVDQAHEVRIDFDLCLSSSCDKLESASCMVEQSGTELIVHAKASVKHDSGRACTEDCGRAETTCSTEALAAGTYTLVYAGQRSEIVVPLAEPACTQVF